ncbi:MAG: tRNA adenosine(34) deaminase TadA [Bacteroidota bacterium]
MKEDELLFSDEYFMREALRMAQQAYHRGEIPVGAVVVAQQRIIARGFNQTELLNDCTAHAELIAYTAASGGLASKYLGECTLYVTLEPCVMCAGALFWAQLGRLVYGASDDKRGYHLTGKNILHPRTSVTKGILEKECSELLSNFFKEMREKKAKP